MRKQRIEEGRTQRIKSSKQQQGRRTKKARHIREIEREWLRNRTQRNREARSCCRSQPTCIIEGEPTRTLRRLSAAAMRLSNSARFAESSTRSASCVADRRRDGQSEMGSQRWAVRDGQSETGSQRRAVRDGHGWIQADSGHKKSGNTPSADSVGSAHGARAAPPASSKASLQPSEPNNT